VVKIPFTRIAKEKCGAGADGQHRGPRGLSKLIPVTPQGAGVVSLESMEAAVMARIPKGPRSRTSWPSTKGSRPPKRFRRPSFSNNPPKTAIRSEFQSSFFMPGRPAALFFCPLFFICVNPRSSVSVIAVKREELGVRGKDFSCLLLLLVYYLCSSAFICVPLCLLSQPPPWDCFARFSGIR